VSSLSSLIANDMNQSAEMGNVSRYGPIDARP
jgi:hypothetical protein